jgi:hypothetical protein
MCKQLIGLGIFDTQVCSIRSIMRHPKGSIVTSVCDLTNSNKLRPVNKFQSEIVRNPHNSHLIFRYRGCAPIHVQARKLDGFGSVGGDSDARKR